MSIPINSGQGPTVSTDYQSPYGPRTSKTSFAQTIAQAQSSSLTLTTAEGDRVTLSDISRSYQSTQFFGWSDPTSSGMRLASSSSSVEAMGLTVQGDLNEQELADITRLVGEMTAIASDFFAGDHESAIGKAMDFGGFDMGSVSSLAASFSRQTVTHTQITSQQSQSVAADLPKLNGQNLKDIYGKPGMDFDEEEDRVALMQGRWEQILKALDEMKRQELEDLFARRPEQQPVPNKVLPAEVSGELQAPTSDSIPVNREAEGPDEQAVPAEDRAARQMMAHMEQLLNKHPKLAPFADRLATTAMEKAASQTEHDRSDIARAFGTLREAFRNQLHQRYSPPEELPNTEPLTEV